MVRYSFLVGLFHPRLHAGLSRRLRLLTRAARKGAATVRKRLLIKSTKPAVAPPRCAGRNDEDDA